MDPQQSARRRRGQQLSSRGSYPQCLNFQGGYGPGFSTDEQVYLDGQRHHPAGQPQGQYYGNISARNIDQWFNHLPFNNREQPFLWNCENSQFNNHSFDVFSEPAYDPARSTDFRQFHTNEERFDLFQNLLMPGQKHPQGKTYLAIYWVECDGLKPESLYSPLFENDHGSTPGPIGNCHAEDHLLKHLLLLLSVIDKDKLKQVTIMQNSSPCSQCAKAYKRDLGTLQNKVRLVFSSLHWVRRSSNNHHQEQIHYFKHEQNRDGLLQLRKSGMEIRSTLYEDWLRLCSALQLPRPMFLLSKKAYESSPRGIEDAQLISDLFLLS